MSDSNDQTIESYEKHVQEYINGTPQAVEGVVKEWIDRALEGLPQDARILECGSANGRDAAYMQQAGYAVQCSDATQAFVDMLQEKGFNAKKLNLLEDELGGPYDLVLANAVLLHFTRDEVARVLQKVREALDVNGRFAFTLKQGEGEEWSEYKLGAPRFFCYWTEEQIRSYITEAGFSDIEVVDGKATARATWIQIIARK